jgi:hypothetical protein
LRAHSALKILALQQLAVFHRKQPQPLLNFVDRFFLLRHICRWINVLIIVTGSNK